MSKRSLLFIGPVLTASGYGVHSRQLLRALVDSGAYELFVESTRWGDTSYIHGAEVEWIRPLILAREAAGDRKYDVSVQVSIPNEFRRVGRLTVGVTAGIEVDRVSPTWLQKVNDEVDLLVVPSEHSLRTFTDTRYQAPDGQVLALQRAAVVIPESVPEGFRPEELAESMIPDAPASNLLVVGLGLDKPLGEDRKNISNTVLWFLREFKDREDVGLVLKVQIVNGSLMDFETVRRRVGELRALAGVGEFPRVTLLHGRLPDEQMARLYNDPRVSALVSLTHGEGFGLPLLEAAACGLPVVATSWSGHLDFLRQGDHDMYIPVRHVLAEIPDSAVWEGVMDRGSRWANVSEDDASGAMRLAAVSFETEASFVRDRALSHSEFVRQEFSQRALQDRLTRILGDAWTQVTLQRPETKEETVTAIRRQLSLPGDRKTLIFTMPMSAGDVYLSTAVLHELKRDCFVVFATKPQYRSILEGNPDIDMIVDWQPWMQDVGLLEDVFDHVYTPNLAIQMVWSNWVHRGQGRNLFHEIAAQCGVNRENLGAPLISQLPVEGLPAHYIVIHTGSGKGQWGARRYNQWQDVVDNLRSTLKWAGEQADHQIVDLPGSPGDQAVALINPQYPGFEKLAIVQVGLSDEPLITGAIDFRGRTPDYRQLATVVAGASLSISIDSLVMHLAAHHGVPHVALFGGSYAWSTGTAYGGKETVPVKPFMTQGIRRSLLETTDRLGCERACYKNECGKDPDSPCVNNIDPRDVLEHAVQILTMDSGRPDLCTKIMERARGSFARRRPSISGYTHTLNPKTHGYPFVQSIRSMLGFCDEVVVVDGGSTDGSWDDIAAIGDPRIKIIANRWDPDEPGMDGIQKAFGRVMCDPAAEFLWQQDCDEIVHEEDYEKVLTAARSFPGDVSVMHLPVIELWGDDRHFRTDRHAWKWRLSRNDFNVTHGIVQQARLVGKDGRTYAKEGMSDGCEYIDVMTGQYLPHKGFWTDELERVRRADPAEYGRRMNALFERLPCVYHYSWADLPRKVRNFRDFWDDCWTQLYRRPPVRRFPDVVSEEDVLRTAEELRERGGEHGPSALVDLRRSAPTSMIGWCDGRGASQEGHGHPPQGHEVREVPDDTAGGG